MWNNNIRSTQFGCTPISKVKKVNIVSVYSLLKEQGLSYGTIHFFNKILSSVFNMAIDDGAVQINPTARAMNDVEGSHTIRDALTVKQQAGLLEFAETFDHSMYQKLVIMLESMCRISELCGLTWEDIDLKKRQILIDHQLQYIQLPEDDKAVLHITKTKSKNARYIPILNETYQTLLNLKKYYFINKKDYVVDKKYAVILQKCKAEGFKCKPKLRHRNSFSGKVIKESEKLILKKKGKISCQY